MNDNINTINPLKTDKQIQEKENSEAMSQVLY